MKGQLTDQFVPDHEDLLTTILSSRIDAVVPVKEGRYGADKKLVSIGDLLRLQRYGISELEAHGIKIVDAEKRSRKPRRIFIAPKVVSRELLKGTDWVDINIADILARIPGSERSRLRVGGCLHRGILIPWRNLELDEQEDS